MTNTDKMKKFLSLKDRYPSKCNMGWFKFVERFCVKGITCENVDCNGGTCFVKEDGTNYYCDCGSGYSKRFYKNGACPDQTSSQVECMRRFD